MWSSDDYGERKAKALETSNFAQTCNLLSRYMKKKGSLKDLNLEIGGKVESLETLVKPGSLLASSSDTSRNGWKSGHPTAENPVIMVEDDSNKTSTSRQGTMKDDKKKAQLTIFYGGKVLVFDDFPANKVREVVHLAKRSSSQMSYGFTSSVVVQEQEKEKEKEKERPNHVHAASTSSPRDGLPPRPKAQAAGKQHVSVKDKVSISSVTEAGPSTSKPQEDLSPTSSDGNGSDLPIARRSSLHRFLEKRKDRYVGNIHTQVTEPLVQEVFASTGPVESCKLIRKDKSSYGFVHYFDRRSASLAILTLNGRHLFGQPIKVNWAYASGQREDTSSHYNIFVGDLSPEVTDAMLYACFSVYSACSDARVMWDQKTGRSRGFGFVSFRNQQDAQSAINDLTGKWLGSRQIRCNWATKGAGTSDDKQSSDSKSVVELTPSEDVKEAASSDAPENNPLFTTVYVGNLAPEVTQVDLHRHFHALNAGSIEEVRVQRDKGFGFIRYSTHAGAAMAISVGNAQSYLCGKQIKCSWGNKPTPAGTGSNPLPPPTPASLPGLSAADLLYERQIAINKMGGMHPLMHPQGQHHLKQASMGMGAGASQAIYDGGYQNVAGAQHLMYYQQ